MLYRDYVKTLSQRFEQAFEDIMAGHNFDNGPEFEIALCHVFRRVLPQRFGIARGYVVARNGDREGDDIIIYDRMGFPTLSAREHEGFARKEHIPVEAVLLFVEAKHTLKLDDSAQGLTHAVEQVAKVKQLLQTRSPRPFNRLFPTIDFEGIPHPPPTAPPHLNPPFTAICARKIDCAAEDFMNRKTAAIQAAKCSPDSLPDIVVAGPEVVAIPCFPDGYNKYGYRMPFLVRDKTRLVFWRRGHAFGVFISALMHGLEWIQLDRLGWGTIIEDALMSEKREAPNSTP